MPTIADVYRALNALQSEKIVEKYAVCGDIGLLFYPVEPTISYHLEIVVADSKNLVSSLKNWARKNGFAWRDGFLWVHSVPVQIKSAKSDLEKHALEGPRFFDYDGVCVPVVAPEILILLVLSSANSQRRARAFDLVEHGSLNQKLLKFLIGKHDLAGVWRAAGGEIL